MDELFIRAQGYGSKQVLLLWNKEDLICNNDILSAMFPDAGLLEQLASVIGQAKNGDPLNLGHVAQELNISDKKALNIFISAGLKICEELGIVTKWEDRFYLKTSVENINWAKSACYQEGIQEKNAFKCFANSTFPWEEKTEVV